MFRIILIFFLLSTPVGLSAQKKWDLKSCVEHAMLNNIAVKQSDLQSKINALNLKQSVLSQLPNFNLSTSGAYNSGNNQDPTTFTRVTQTYYSAGVQLQSSADIFNFFSKRNTVAANEWELMAAKANVNKVKYDVALSTANAYLQVLLAEEQTKIASTQIFQTTTQLNRTKKLVDAGTLPELNVTQLEAQLALDSGNYIASKGNFSQAMLSLKALMNIDAGEAFEIETPPIEAIPVDAIADLQPDYVYNEALKNQPQQLGNEYRLKAAQKSIEASRASRYPSLIAFASLGTNYLYFDKRPIYEKIITGYTSTGLVANAGGGVLYDVQSPLFVNGNVIDYFKSSSFGEQLKNNFRKSFGLSLNVPIFNGWSSSANYERSKLNLGRIQLQKEQDNQKLKQDIYQAYNAAMVALEKNNAALKSVQASEKAYEFAGKRFSIGALSTYDYIATQNTLLRAKLEYSIAQFDYVFKMKVLEFYKGAGLKL
ncbi:MAG: TolC family protein [Ferruginibacter sp.]|nr:TolC family protein [Ferruginibacter sp.]